MKAVVWTDVFQSGIMTAGLLAIVIQVIKYSKICTKENEGYNTTHFRKRCSVCIMRMYI